MATLLQAYELRALIMILDGVDEAAGMRQYTEDLYCALVPSGNCILIASPDGSLGGHGETGFAP